MSKKNTTATTTDAATTSENGENVQAPVIETPKVMIPVTIDGVVRMVEVSPKDAVNIDKMLAESPEVKAQKEADRRAKIAADQKAKRDAEREAKKNDPEWLAKEAARQAKRDANKEKLAARDANRDRREAKKKEVLDAKIGFLTESGSLLPIDRLLEARITKKYAHGMKEEGVQRGWAWKVVYLTKSKKTVTVDEVIDLDKEGVGTLETAYADARKAIIDTLAELS